MSFSELPQDPSVEYSVITHDITTRGDSGGSNSGAFWVAIANRETAICICTPFSNTFQVSSLPHSEIFCAAVSTAFHNGLLGMHISGDDSNAVTKLGTLPIPSDPAPGLSIPDDSGLPMYDLNTFTPLDLLVSKQIYSRGIKDLQEELDNYFRAQSSSYILPLQGMISAPELYVEPETMRVRSRKRIVGFLLPFVGILSNWLIGGEWTVDEKEFLAVTLLDGVLDVERRGVHLSDLRSDNILLTSTGLKIIDLSSTTHTPGYNDRWSFSSVTGPHRTPFGLGRAIAELFLEKHGPSSLSSTYIHCSVTAPFVEVIKRCCTAFSQEFQSVAQLWDATTSLLQPIRERALSKGITISSLCDARWRRIEYEAKSWEELHFGQTRDGDKAPTPWLPEFARASARRQFVRPEDDEAELWCDSKPITQADSNELGDPSTTTKFFDRLFWSDSSCNQAGDRLLTHWVLPRRESETAVCVCTPLAGCQTRLEDSDIFQLAVQRAVEDGFNGVFIATNNTISQYDAFMPDPPPCPTNIIGLQVPDDVDFPILDEHDPRLIYCDVLMFRDRDIRLIKLNGSYFVYKYFNGDPASLQEELDRHIQLRGSPHILGLKGLVRVTDYHIDPKTFRVESFPWIFGFLLPFAGSWSSWWIGGEWHYTHKQYMAVRLLDAVLAIERAGVHLAELSKDNVLLTEKGLKVDLSTQSHLLTLGLDDTSIAPATRTVFALGKAFAELFLERYPSAGAHTYIPAKTPPVFVDIIKRCCAIHTDRYCSVEDLYSDVSESLVEIRSQSMSSTGMAAYRAINLKTEGVTFDQAEFGQTARPDPQPWTPPWAVEIRRRYWEPPKSHEAELWIDERPLDA